MGNPAKYPKTKHLPWSPNRNVNTVDTIENFIGKEIVILEKMDGANCLINSQGVYSRSCEGQAYGNNWDYIKGYHAAIKSRIDDEFSIFGENLFLKHSIEYKDLPHYLMIFGIRKDAESSWLSWPGVKIWADDLSIPTVPELWEGIVSSEKELAELTNELGNQNSSYGEREGLVVRAAKRFEDKDFQINVAKWVRAGHVKGQHWTKNTPIKNRRAMSQPCRICGSIENLTLIKGQGFFCQDHINEPLVLKGE